MKYLKTTLAILCITTLVACSNAEKAGYAAWGKKHRVTLYSGGKQVGHWVTSGKIENEEHSDGCYFADDSTGKLVRVTGTVVIEVE